MENLVFIGSHLGYPMERTPLGGGAMVGLQLSRHWAVAGRFRLLAIGSGPLPPGPGVSYLQLPAPESPGSGPDLVRLSELGYARFCREFEAATTEYLIRNEGFLDPRRTALVVNDVSESPDLACAARLGYRILSIWHVDVVDFFNRIYLRGLLPAPRLTRAFAWLDRSGLGRWTPDVLRLVFQKQQEAVRWSDRLVLPSRRMAQTLKSCYAGIPEARPESLEERSMVVPWGGWRDAFPPERVDNEASRLRAHYRIGPESRVLMTLSRISPEKGLSILMEALAILEAGEPPAGDLCVLVCGEPAFMRGEAYDRRVRSLAGRLRRVRVFFPGYLSSFDKQAHFRLAHLFVSASIHESYGLTLVEAMQAGLPVLASDHYGVEEILDDSRGRVVAYGPERSRAPRLAQALRELLGSPERLRAMGARAREASSSMTFARAAERIAEAAAALLDDPAVGSDGEKS